MRLVEIAVHRGPGLQQEPLTSERDAPSPLDPEAGDPLQRVCAARLASGWRPDHALYAAFAFSIISTKRRKR